MKGGFQILVLYVISVTLALRTHEFFGIHKQITEVVRHWNGAKKVFQSATTHIPSLDFNVE